MVEYSIRNLLDKKELCKEFSDPSKKKTKKFFLKNSGNTFGPTSNFSELISKALQNIVDETDSDVEDTSYFSQESFSSNCYVS